MNELVDFALKFSQAGTVAILLVMIGGLAYAINIMWKYHVESSERTIALVERASIALEKHTAAVEANARATETQAHSINALKDTFEKLQDACQEALMGKGGGRRM